jgi:hypothetical protein
LRYFPQAFQVNPTAGENLQAMDEYLYCPSCGAEYRRGFTRCADCDVELVGEPPKQPEADSERADDDYHSVLDPLHPDYIYDPGDWEHGLEPIRLTSASSEIEAEMLVGMLRTNGLRTYFKNESPHPISHYGGQAARYGALALYRIYVHPADDSEARRLLASLDLEEDPHDGGEEDAETLAAPRSGIITAVLVVLAVILVLLILLFGVNYS